MIAWLELLAPALFAGVFLVALAAPLGCLVIWKGMAFFADTLAHGALLGVAIAAAMALPLWLGMLLTAMLLALTLWLINDERLPNDALLAAFSAASLSIGLIIITQIQTLRASVMAYLFGDILAINWSLAALYIPLCIVGLIALKLMWPAQIRIAMSEALAVSDGIDLKLQKIAFVLLVALFTVIALQAVGSLLISSLLVLPAITARLFSRSPRQMVIISLMIGFIGLFSGIGVSAIFNLASGLTVVVMLALLFFIGFCASKLNRHLS